MDNTDEYTMNNDKYDNDSNNDLNETTEHIEIKEEVIGDNTHDEDIIEENNNESTTSRIPSRVREQTKHCDPSFISKSYGPQFLNMLNHNKHNPTGKIGKSPVHLPVNIIFTRMKVDDEAEKSKEGNF